MIFHGYLGCLSKVGISTAAEWQELGTQTPGTLFSCLGGRKTDGVGVPPETAVAVYRD